MANSKILVKIGHLEFSAEGEEQWLATQLDILLEKVPELLQIELNTDPAVTDTQNKPTNLQTSQGKPTLVSWLKDKNATSDETRRFLATAAYLQLNGKNRLATNDVTDALSNSNQGKFSSASMFLKGNVAKGFCEKEGKSFYVTTEGFEELGVKHE